MYQVEGSSTVLRGRAALLAGRPPRVSRNVVLLGLVSLFTDVSSEMVATILPLYVVYSLGLSPLAYGVIDGAYQGGWRSCASRAASSPTVSGGTRRWPRLAMRYLP